MLSGDIKIQIILDKLNYQRNSNNKHFMLKNSTKNRKGQGCLLLTLKNSIYFLLLISLCMNKVTNLNNSEQLKINKRKRKIGQM